MAARSMSIPLDGVDGRNRDGEVRGCSRDIGRRASGLRGPQRRQGEIGLAVEIVIGDGVELAERDQILPRLGGRDIRVIPSDHDLHARGLDAAGGLAGPQREGDR